MKLFKPEIFQGSQKKDNYFEGWYLKHVTADLGNVYSFIPGISLAGDESHAFIQVFNGITGRTHYARYVKDEFTWDRDRFLVRVGESVFSDRFMELNIMKDDINVAGRIDYSGNVPYPKTLFSPGIMGWYSYIPFMECKHGVVSVGHSLAGSITVEGNTIDFTGGRGYIEKDWGESFPESWIWLQCNTFSEPESSLMVSIAKIPWLGRFFIGFISFLYLKGDFYLFSTYNGSRITGLDHRGADLSITMENKNSILRVTARRMLSGELKAPKTGRMSRLIKESIDSTVDVALTDRKGKILYEDRGPRAGLEIIETIFEYRDEILS